MRSLLLLFILLGNVYASAQNDLDKLVQRQAAFGKTIPQEKVYIHMDNTCYQLGDTIWFSAYTRRTDTDKPSDVSGLLYVELYGQDGYMIERKQIQMREGHGEGFFDLSKQIMYAGFYELRAYTRWQLNWGMFEHPHTTDMSDLFVDEQQEKDYYRDYYKLYSRVFPVYDKPAAPGEFDHDMTLRALRRAYKSESDKRNLTLNLFPEGGNLVEGLPCRLAFEATWDDGQWAEGYLHYGTDSVKTEHRGRGVMQITPEQGMDRDISFVTAKGESVKVKLPKAETTGVSLSIDQTEDGWVMYIQHTQDLNTDSLALSVMHEGRLVTSAHLNSIDKEGAGYKFQIGKSQLSESGVYQATLFDAQGRVFADRLFFSKGNLQQTSTISINGIKEEYQPYEPINLTLKAPTGKNHLSLAVKDDEHRDFLYDSGNILTEMLLSSEIRGFIPQPEWYFQADDAEHQRGLDLLMMTQGWRRFDWHEMAVRGAWEIVQPAEKSPILLCSVFDNDDWFQRSGEVTSAEEAEYDKYQNALNESTSAKDIRDGKRAMQKKWEKESLGKKLKVHAEAVVLGEETGYLSEGVTDHAKFRLILPPYYGQYVLFISVADTTKWKKEKPYVWVQAEPFDEDHDNEVMAKSAKINRMTRVDPARYLAKISWPYPMFVSPYNYYQDHLSARPDEEQPAAQKLADGTTVMREVTIKRHRNALRRFNDAWPILAIDAEVAKNMETDIGLSFMTLMTNSYGIHIPEHETFGEPLFDTRFGFGQTRRQLNGLNVSPDSLYARKYLKSGTFKLTPQNTGNKPIGQDAGQDEFMYLSPGESREYEGTGVWDTYVLYSDYSPRMEGDKQYVADPPKTKLVKYPFADGSRRMTYRDRRYVLNGFAYPAQFYSPDYSKQQPDAEHADYRRTLYWNPNLQFDENGQAQVTFYNNSRTTQLSIEAEGQASDGTLLWGKGE